MMKDEDIAAYRQRVVDFIFGLRSLAYFWRGPLTAINMIDAFMVNVDGQLFEWKMNGMSIEDYKQLWTLRMETRKVAGAIRFELEMHRWGFDKRIVRDDFDVSQN